ncbi:unnamed protein product [Dovyalis caffra]|uniref:Uncharacterized protein n=1 Tax=Dovyalis caffra TaxID=77055 RepID=A0AAV1RC69_9ROSI|nr:unnamed protein product [Dovyalis caffra]
MECMTIRSAYNIRCFSPVRGRCQQFPKPFVGPHVYKFSNFLHQSDSATKEKEKKFFITTWHSLQACAHAKIKAKYLNPIVDHVISKCTSRGKVFHVFRIGSSERVVQGLPENYNFKEMEEKDSTIQNVTGDDLMTLFQETKLMKDKPQASALFRSTQTLENQSPTELNAWTKTSEAEKKINANE